LARASQFASPSQKAKIKAKVHKKFPAIGKGDAEKGKGEAKNRRVEVTVR
jgi:outer membrane protein OmpA-like peptidoglycan-associated protein